jgi:predicted DNA-binding protein (UPF0251 family)
MKYPREYSWFVERVLKEHPRNVDELKRLEEMITACCHSPTISDSGVRNEDKGASEEERILEIKEHNSSYQRISRRVDAINAGLKVLKPDELELVELLLWGGVWKSEVAELMNIEERTVLNMKIRMLKKIAPFVIGDWVDKNT